MCCEGAQHEHDTRLASARRSLPASLPARCNVWRDHRPWGDLLADTTVWYYVLDDDSEDAALPGTPNFDSMHTGLVGSKRRADNDDPEALPADPVAAALLQALGQYGALRAADLEPMQTRLEQHGRQMEQHDQQISSLQQAMAEIKEELAACRKELADTAKSAQTSAAAAAAASASATSAGDAWGRASAVRAGGTGGPPSEMDTGSVASDAPWAPRAIILRGFAPFGCGPEAKISKAEFPSVIEAVMEAIPPEWRPRLQPSPPYALNHQLQLFVEPGGWDSVRRAKLAVEKAFHERDFKIKGKTVRVGVQTSPDRRAQCANVFRAVEVLRQMGVRDNEMELCQRSLVLYKLPSYEVAGRTARPAEGGGWRWSDAVLRSMELDPQAVRAKEAEATL